MFVLQDLWRGNISPIERYIRPCSEYKKCSDKAVKEYDKLLTCLSPEEKQIFDNYNELNMKLLSMSEEESFINGFRLGAKIILDVLGEHKGQFGTIGDR